MTLTLKIKKLVSYQKGERNECIRLVGTTSTGKTYAAYCFGPLAKEIRLAVDDIVGPTGLVQDALDKGLTIVADGEFKPVNRVVKERRFVQHQFEMSRATVLGGPSVKLFDLQSEAGKLYRDVAELEQAGDLVAALEKMKNFVARLGGIDDYDVDHDRELEGLVSELGAAPDDNPELAAIGRFMPTTEVMSVLEAAKAATDRQDVIEHDLDDAGDRTIADLTVEAASVEASVVPEVADAREGPADVDHVAVVLETHAIDDRQAEHPSSAVSDENVQEVASNAPVVDTTSSTEFPQDGVSDHDPDKVADRDVPLVEKPAETPPASGPTEAAVSPESVTQTGPETPEVARTDLQEKPDTSTASKVEAVAEAPRPKTDQSTKTTAALPAAGSVRPAVGVRPVGMGGIGGMGGMGGMSGLGMRSAGGMAARPQPPAAKVEEPADEIDEDEQEPEAPKPSVPVPGMRM